MISSGKQQKSLFLVPSIISNEDVDFDEEGISGDP